MTRLQPLVRARVARLGAVGAAWADALPGRLDELCSAWDLRLGRPLPGGSASYVVRVHTAADEPRVLKVLVPDPELADEAPVLAAADGVGYARLHATAPDALLLEELGESLERAGAPPEESFAALVDTLALAWRVTPDQTGGTPVDRAALLLEGLDRHSSQAPEEVVAEVGRVVDAAREVAGALSTAYDPVRAVVAHGDAHPGNLLRRADDGWAFVDPDGPVVEAAYDLGVALRDHSRRLLESSDPRGLHRSWVELVADRAEADAERVTAWAFLERVSTGLFVCALGSPAVGLPFLRSADRLLPARP